MRVVLLTTSFLPHIGGMEWVVHNLANALEELGNDVCVMARSANSPDLEIPRHYDLIRYGRSGRGGGRSHLVDVEVVGRLAFRKARAGVDVVNAHGVVESGVQARWFREMTGVPIVLTPHGEDVQVDASVGYGRRLDPQVAGVVRRNLEAADAITAISQAIAGSAIEAGAPSERISLIPNGVWLRDFREPSNRQAVRQALRVPSDAFLVVAVGRNHPKKGFRLLVDAVAAAHKTAPELFLAIVGRETEPLHTLAHELGIAPWVATTGEVPHDRLAAILQAADCFVSSSIVEGLPVANLEAMAAGLPMVVTDVPGNRDVFAPGCGLLVTAGSVLDLAAALVTMCHDGALRQASAAEARSRSDDHDWLRVAQAYCQVYAAVQGLDHARRSRTPRTGSGGTGRLEE